MVFQVHTKVSFPRIRLVHRHVHCRVGAPSLLKSVILKTYTGLVWSGQLKSYYFHRVILSTLAHNSLITLLTRFFVFHWKAVPIKTNLNSFIHGDAAKKPISSTIPRYSCRTSTYWLFKHWTPFCPRCECRLCLDYNNVAILHALPRLVNNPFTLVHHCEAKERLEPQNCHKEFEVHWLSIFRFFVPVLVVDYLADT